MKSPASAEQLDYAERKRRLEAAIAEGLKGPFHEFNNEQLLKEIHDAHPELLK